MTQCTFQGSEYDAQTQVLQMKMIMNILYDYKLVFFTVPSRIFHLF